MRNHGSISCRMKLGLVGALALLLGACATDTVAPLARSAGEPSNSQQTLMRVADSAWNSGDTNTALALYRKAADGEPASSVAINRYGSALVHAGAPQEAVSVFRRVLGFEPQNNEALRGLGNALVALGQGSLAAGNFEAALAADPRDWRSMNGLGVVRDMAGRHAEAQTLYRQALALAPDSGAARNNFGLSLAMSGNYPEAIRTLEPLGRQPQASARHTLNLALVYGLANQPERAALVARSHLDEASVQRNLEYYAMLRGLDPEARRQALRANPSYFPGGGGQPPNG